MSESKHEQIVAALVTLLDGITSDGGTTYWYAPNVTRIPGMSPDILMPEKASGSASICAVIPEDEDVEEESTHEITKRARYNLALLKLWNPSVERPFVTPNPDRLKIQNRLAQDTEKAIYADLQLGGLCENCEIVMVDRAAERTFVEAWAVVFVRLSILYSHDKATP